MESANKEEAKRCLQKAVAALKQGKTLYAQKLALKSIRLCPTTEAQGQDTSHSTFSVQTCIIIIMCHQSL